MRQVVFGAPRAFPRNFSFPANAEKQPILDQEPKTVIKSLTFWVGGITYAVQVEFNNGTKSPVFGQDGGLPLKLEFPETATYRKLVMEFSRVSKFLRSMVLYGENDEIISKVEIP